jgi:hypothetical protein
MQPGRRNRESTMHATPLGHMKNVLVLAMLVAVTANCAPEPSSPQQPNIILIMADDLGYET